MSVATSDLKQFKIYSIFNPILSLLEYQVQTRSEILQLYATSIVLLLLQCDTSRVAGWLPPILSLPIAAILKHVWYGAIGVTPLDDPLTLDGYLFIPVADQ
ncbi:unnamed protein product [Aspergillus oryzae]|uniref:Unnamed protein product n=2 Tax=Aspergillus oryzae TaxID=5062 RepID=A0AAN4YB78_ASPOZ|nr:unnamed protein product [Aspergillus oryzae]GMF92193.1 unnamed protein product [Aspergillus oryzae]GMG00894.1 unnamed protein product [Aspergillus oryzae]GMG26719.1 unnamed protein product [Aspergillus oryzae]GMG52931.1 unnamed protein product [Aspergillus oryzae var. brunneus]